MNRRRRRRKNYTTYILVGVAAALAAVLCAVLLTQCLGGGGANGQSSGGTTSSAPHSAADSGAGSLPASSVGPPDSSPGESTSPSESSSVAGSESESESQSESEKQPQPPPVFVDGKVEVKVDEDGKKVTVTYKTNVESTVNAILSTSGEGISTGTFYDHFNRGQKFDWAVGKRQTYTVTSAGKSETFELPDPTKTYYLYLNAVENETDVWQTGVTVLLLREGDPTASAPSSSSGSGSSSSSG